MGCLLVEPVVLVVIALAGLAIVPLVVLFGSMVGLYGLSVPWRARRLDVPVFSIVAGDAALIRALASRR